MDSAIGVHIIDRWTFYALEFLEKVAPSSKATVADFVRRENFSVGEGVWLRVGVRVGGVGF